MTDELIQKFFRRECTAEEAAQVSAYLKDNPEILNKHLNEKEWNELEPGIMAEEFWEEIWQTIARKKKAHTVALWVKRTAVAASIGGLIVISLYKYPLFQRTEYSRKNDPEASVITVAAVQKMVANESRKNDTIHLPDNSTIVLSKGSVVKYHDPFQNSKRDIELEGEAYFKVAKDTSRPFTVYAGGLSTTALGTEFKITASKGTNSLRVQLFKGKVVIKRVSDNVKGWKEDVYLSPGEQLQYDVTKMFATVEKIKDVERRTRSEQAIMANKKSKEADADLVFSGSSLAEVLEKLSKHYNVKIEYNKTEMDTMSFTGTVTRNDSLPVILKVIAQMNDLEVTAGENGFTVQKINAEK